MPEERRQMTTEQARKMILRDLRTSLFYAQDHPPEQGSAALAELHSSFVFLVEGFMERIESASWDAKRDRPMDTKLARQCEAMNEFLFPEALPNEDAMMEDIVRAGASLDFARQVIQQQRQRRGYRRMTATFRASVIRAHDLKLAGKNVAQITAETCDCGGKKHGESCRQKTMRRLKVMENLLQPVR